MLLGDGGEEEENFSLFDFRFSLSDSVDGRLEMLGHPPWGGGALGSLALVRYISISIFNKVGALVRRSLVLSSSLSGCGAVSLVGL